MKITREQLDELLRLITKSVLKEYSSMSSDTQDDSSDSGTADDGVKPQDAQTAVEKAKAERDALPPPTPAPPMEPKVFFSTKDAAKFINKSYSWLRRARDVPGTGPIYYKIGSQCLYELPSLEAWKERTSVP